MELKQKFKVIYSPDAREFLGKVDNKTREKIIYNIRNSS